MLPFTIQPGSFELRFTKTILFPPPFLFFTKYRHDSNMIRYGTYKVYFLFFLSINVKEKLTLFFKWGQRQYCAE